MMSTPFPDAFPVDESAVICRLAAGDESAFYLIFERYHHGVYRYIKRFVKSHDLADDVTQEVFVKVWEIRATIKPEASFKGFVFTIARNHVLNVLKRASRENSLKKIITASALLASNHCEDQVVLNDLQSFAERVINDLPPQRKAVFNLFRNEGKDYKEIAGILGISKNTVRDHLSRASKFIRARLKVHSGIASCTWVGMPVVRALTDWLSG